MVLQCSRFVRVICVFTIVRTSKLLFFFIVLFAFPLAFT